MTGATSHGKKGLVRYYKHRPIEGKTVTCSVKYFRADRIEEAVENHLLIVVQREGYFDELEETLKDQHAARENAAISLKRDLEIKLGQTDADIKKLVRLQMRSDDNDLAELYTDQLREMQSQRTVIGEQLESAREDLERVLSPANMRVNVEANIKTFQKVWSKSPSAAKKKLIRLMIDCFILTEDSIEIYYHSDQVAGSFGEPNEPKKETKLNNPIQFGQARLLKSKNNLDSYRAARWTDHNAKIVGSSVVKIGCGGRI